MLVGTNLCVQVVFLWEETGVLGENPPAWPGDNLTFSHDDAEYKTQVAAVWDERFTIVPARQTCYSNVSFDM